MANVCCSSGPIDHPASIPPFPLIEIGGLFEAQGSHSEKWAVDGLTSVRKKRGWTLVLVLIPVLSWLSIQMRSLYFQFLQPFLPIFMRLMRKRIQKHFVNIALTGSAAGLQACNQSHLHPANEPKWKKPTIINSTQNQRLHSIDSTWNIDPSCRLPMKDLMPVSSTT